MTTSTQPADLLALVAKWRERANYMLRAAQLMADPAPASREAEKINAFADELQAAIESLAAHRVEVEQRAMRFCIGEAKALLSFFGGNNTDVSEAGKYAWCSDYPEEGAMWLGQHDIDTEEHDDKPAHPPQAQADPDEEMATNVWKRTEAYIRGYEDGKLDATQAQAGAGDADFQLLLKATDDANAKACASGGFNSIDEVVPFIWNRFDQLKAEAKP